MVDLKSLFFLFGGIPLLTMTALIVFAPLAMLLGFRMYTIDNLSESIRYLSDMDREKHIISWHRTMLHGCDVPRGITFGLWFVAWCPADFKKDRLTIICTEHLIQKMKAMSDDYVPVHGDIMCQHDWSYIGYLTEWQVEKTPNQHQQLLLDSIRDNRYGSCKVHLITGPSGAGKSTVSLFLANQIKCARLVTTKKHISVIFSEMNPSAESPVVVWTDEFESSIITKKSFNDQCDFVNNSKHIYWMLTTNRSINELTTMDFSTDAETETGTGTGTGTELDDKNVAKKAKKRKGFDESCFREGRVCLHDWFAKCNQKTRGHKIKGLL
jgi:hypothetical protein